jgi:hypothetical protein
MAHDKLPAALWFEPRAFAKHSDRDRINAELADWGTTQLNGLYSRGEAATRLSTLGTPVQLNSAPLCRRLDGLIVEVPRASKSFDQAPAIANDFLIFRKGNFLRVQGVFQTTGAAVLHAPKMRSRVVNGKTECIQIAGEKMVAAVQLRDI